MSKNQIAGVIESYQKSRVHFSSNIADLCIRQQNLELLWKSGIVSLLRPLVVDEVPSVKYNSLVALGRIASHSEKTAASIIDTKVLTEIIETIDSESKHYKRAAAFVIRAIAKHSQKLSEAAIECGSLKLLLEGLDDYDSEVREGSVWAISYICMHSEELATKVMEGGAFPSILRCIEENNVNLQRICVSTIGDIAKNSSKLSEMLVQEGAIPNLLKLLDEDDVKLRRQVCKALSQVVKHSPEFAEQVANVEVFQRLISCLRENDTMLKKFAASLVRELIKHGQEYAQIAIKSGIVASLVDALKTTKGEARLPIIVSLGWIASFSPQLALSVIVSKGVQPLVDAINEESESHILAAIAWSIGQIGHHDPKSARAVSEIGALPKLLGIYMDENSGEDLKKKAKRSLKTILEQCEYVPALEELVFKAPQNILKYICFQLSQMLPQDIQLRKNFVSCGGLQRLQEVYPESTGKFKEVINKINSLYPDEVVRYYSPNYSDKLLEKIEQME